MTTWIRFAPELGAWITHNLERGGTAPALCAVMAEQGMAEAPARSIVEAFLAARAAGAPPPHDAVVLSAPESSPLLLPSSVPVAALDPDADHARAYAAEPMRLASGTSVTTRDRRVGVSFRAERPALAVLTHVLDDDECAQLIELARGRLRPSTIVDPRSGRDVANGQRGSEGMFFRPAENELVARLDERLAELMNLPLSHGEGLQVLHYPTGAGSDAHFDFLLPTNTSNAASVARSGQRMSTLVVYLNDVPQGGCTSFPSAGWAVAPQRGNALYFEYCNSQGQLDPASLHASEPVLAGEKWVATKWMRQQPFVSAANQDLAAKNLLQNDSPRVSELRTND